MVRIKAMRPTAADGPVTGPARFAHSAAEAAKKVRRGDVLILDLSDLDQRTAQQIARTLPAAVINARESLSGRYPAGGPKVLVAAGVPLVDNVGPGILAIKPDSSVSVLDNLVSSGTLKLATGTRQTAASLASAMEAASEGMQVQLATFTANAMDHVANESDALLEGKGLPEPGIDLRDKHVLVVAPGYQHVEQLKAIRGYVREHRPIVIAVGDAADAAKALADAPSTIIGNLDGVSDATLTAAKAVVLHDPTGRDPGRTRVETAGIKHVISHSSLASQDLAILIAHAGGAKVIATAGIESGLIDFLEQGRSDTAGTFLARLRAGGRLVDASTLAAVYKPRHSWWQLGLLVIAALAAVGVAMWVTPGGQTWLKELGTAIGAALGMGS